MATTQMVFGKFFSGLGIMFRG